MPNNQTRLEHRRLQSSYITSTISIILLLLLLGSVGMLLLNAKRLGNYVKENIHFKVILNESLPEGEIFRIQKLLDSRVYVKETNYIPKEQAARELQEALGEDFIETLGYNPLLPTIEVKFLASYANTDSIPIIERDLREFDGINEVYYQKDLIQAVNEKVHEISLIILGISLVFFLIAVSLINNTIRLAVYSKRFLIRTMQLVGATANYIRKPFLLRSTLQGFIGALIALLILTLTIYFLQDQLEGIFSLKELDILLALYAIVIFLGVMLNWISTYFAVTKYIRIKTDKLYT